MNIDIEKIPEIKKLDQTKYDKYKNKYPLSSKYDLSWILINEMGPNAVWLTEWVCEKMDLKPGMKVLDMGCGKAMSSIFLAKEFNVQVWANDLWVDAANNWKRICEENVQDKVFPIHAEAHDLPYANNFFDAIISLDAYQYFGTDDLYLNYFLNFLKPNGQIGIGLVGMNREFENGFPEYFKDWCSPSDITCFHTLLWWKTHWERSALLNMTCADSLNDNLQEWIDFEEIKHTAGSAKFPEELSAIKADKGKNLAFHRLIAEKK